MGRFQFILGREIGVSFFGYGKEEDRMFLPSTSETNPQTTVVAVRSIQLQFPVLEYRPLPYVLHGPEFPSLVFQLFGGVDIPTKITMVSPPEAQVPDHRSTWMLGFRVAFDWRYYLGSGQGGHR